jgi:hypothetical protein
MIAMSLVSLILEQGLGNELTNKTGMQNWGGNLAADFEEFKGYSLVPWLLAVTGRIINSTETTEQFLYDFRSTHAYLTATKSYGYFN